MKEIVQMDLMISLSQILNKSPSLTLRKMSSSMAKNSLSPKSTELALTTSNFSAIKNS